MSDDPFCLTSPEASRRAPRPAPTQPGDRDPYRVRGPAIINISGGRTSAYMLRRVLDAYDGRLPPDVHVVFANTGKELPETYTFLGQCADAWSVPIVWIQRDLKAGGQFRVVDSATAARDSEPFDQLILEKKFLPNGIMRFCTQELKIIPARDYMRAQGYDEWLSVVGLRADEMRRVSRVRDREHDEWTVACPLADAGVTKADVEKFWREQPFDLLLRPWESNCAGCYLRSSSTLERVERDRPGTLDWWIEWEKRMSARFEKRRSMAEIKRRAQLPVLPISIDEDYALPCNCTD